MPCKKAAIAGVTILCVFFFSLQLRVMLGHYENGMTNTAISYDSHLTMELPHITICPKVPHTGQGPVYFEEDYQNRTTALSDILDKVRSYY